MRNPLSHSAIKIKGSYFSYLGGLSVSLTKGRCGVSNGLEAPPCGGNQ